MTAPVRARRRRIGALLVAALLLAGVNATGCGGDPEPTPSAGPPLPPPIREAARTG